MKQEQTDRPLADTPLQERPARSMACAEEEQSLNMSRDEFLGLGEQVLKAAAEHLETQRSERVRNRLPLQLASQISSMPMIEKGASHEDVIGFLTETILPYPLGNGHPRFFGWITSAPAPIGILADLLATAMNANCGASEHVVPELEKAVCRWLMDLTGFPVDGSHGLMVSGGSMANLTALAVARHWACWREGRDVRRLGAAATKDLVIYQSSETHSCIAKAVELLGIGRENLRTIAVDDGLRLRPDLLDEAILADKAAGRQPFCVVATAGTVNSGAIDPLADIADLCETHDLWLHVDGAYGGLAAADPDLQKLLGPIARAWSLALDPHKWLCVPIECGCVLIRDAATQHATFNLQADYLRGKDQSPAHETAWPFEFGLQLTRGPRAVKAAAVLMRLGRSGVVQTIARHRALAAWLAAQIEAAPDLELTTRAPLSIVCFRVVPSGYSSDHEETDRLNAKVAVRVNERGRVFLTPTVIQGRTSLRASIIHYDVRQHDLQTLLDEVQEAAADILRGRD